MATHFRLSQDKANLKQSIFDLKEQAEQARYAEYAAAVRIQSWYCGIRLRCYFRHLIQSVLIIQRHYRARLARKRFVHIVDDAFLKMCDMKYDQSAVIIQKWWKGYRVRQYIFDFYSFKKDMAHLQKVNEEILRKMNEYSEEKKLELKREKEKSYRESLSKWAKSHHHLISTHVQDSIYKSPFIRDPMIPEKIIISQNTNLTKEIKEKRAEQKASVLAQETDNHFNCDYKFDPAWMSYGPKHPPLSKLPPLPASKPQGPFCEPEKVRQQRYKNFNPSLRVMTDFESLRKARDAMQNEEWTKRVHDDPFIPVYHRDKMYEPMLHTTGQYGHIKYGNAHFREYEDSAMNEPKLEPFKSQVPPIYVFDKLNKEYIEGYVET